MPWTQSARRRPLSRFCRQSGKGGQGRTTKAAWQCSSGFLSPTYGRLERDSSVPAPLLREPRGHQARDRFPALLEWMREDKFPLEKLVTNRYSLEQATRPALRWRRSRFSAVPLLSSEGMEPAWHRDRAPQDDHDPSAIACSVVDLVFRNVGCRGARIAVALGSDPVVTAWPTDSDFLRGLGPRRVFRQCPIPAAWPGTSPRDWLVHAHP